MRPRTKLILGAAAAVSISTAASAADFVMAPGAPPPPMAAPGFDWSGPYVGALAGIFNLAGSSFQYAGVQFGYNVVLRDRILAGLEVETAHPFLVGLPYVNAFLNARLGMIAGDRVLLYGEAGIGTFLIGPGPGMFSAGGGVEIAVTNAMSVFGEINRLFFIAGGLIPTGYSTFELGINYHPDGSAMMASSGGAFQGFYFGALGGYTTGFAFADAGVQFGYNMMRGNFVGGLEVATYYPFTGAAIVNASLNARLGFALRDTILIYAEGGIGTYLTAPIASAGGGVEFAFGGGPLSAFTEAKALFVLGGGGYVGTQIHGGVNIAVGN
jgi:opacity protein-like surface antigen